MGSHVFCFEIHTINLDDIYDIDDGINVCFQSFECSHTVGPAFFIHLACWRLAQMREPKLSSDDFYHLGLQLSEAIPRTLFKAPNPWNLASFASGSTVAGSE